MQGLKEKVAPCQPGSGLLSGFKSADVLILDFPASRAVRRARKPSLSEMLPPPLLLLPQLWADEWLRVGGHGGALLALLSPQGPWLRIKGSSSECRSP